MLAMGAIMRVTSTNLESDNGRLAAGARLASSLKNIAPMLRLTFTPEEIALRAPQGNAFSQHLANCNVQPSDFVERERGRRAPGINAGQPQTFIRIAVAQARQHSLVQQHRLEHTPPPLQLTRKHRDIKSRLQGFGAK